MTSNLPLVRLSIINPLFIELERRGVGVGPMLRKYRLPAEFSVSCDLFVAAETIYEIVEACETLSGDKFIGYSVGTALDLLEWPPSAEAAGKASTVGELLTMLAVNAADHSTATRYYVSTEGGRSIFGFERLAPPPFPPAQNDAFHMGFMLRLLRHAAGEKWESADTVFHIVDPDCVPSWARVCQVIRSDGAGVKVSFPAVWLFQPFEKSRFCANSRVEKSALIPGTLLDTLRIALLPHLQDSDLTAEKAASICGYDRRRLARDLRALGTTLAKEITKLRSETAARALTDTDQPIAKIAEAVGFRDPTVFSRAFKNWTGQSPREYRRTHESLK